MMKNARTAAVRLALGSLLGALAVSAAGCDDSDVGVARQFWTIDGRTDPASCANLEATQMRVVAVDGAGTVRGTEFAACSAFVSSIQLNPGTYSVRATLLRANGDPASRTLTIDTFGVSEDQDTVLYLDFPLSTFLGE